MAYTQTLWIFGINYSHVFFQSFLGMHMPPAYALRQALVFLWWGGSKRIFVVYFQRAAVSHPGICPVVIPTAEKKRGVGEG